MRSPPPDRLGRIGSLPVLAQYPSHKHQHREDETLHHHQNLRHVELAPVPPRQERRVERVRPVPPLSRCESKSAASFGLRDEERARQRSLVRSQRSEEHTSELQSRQYLVCRLLLEKK